MKSAPAAEPTAQVRSLSLAEIEKMAVGAHQGAAGEGAVAVVQPEVRAAVTSAILGVVFTGFLVCLLGLASTLLVPDLPLQASRKPEPLDVRALGEAPGEPPQPDRGAG